MYMDTVQILPHFGYILETFGSIFDLIVIDLFQLLLA